MHHKRNFKINPFKEKKNSLAKQKDKNSHAAKAHVSA
jgi:hypothetical protein